MSTRSLFAASAFFLAFAWLASRFAFRFDEPAGSRSAAAAAGGNQALVAAAQAFLASLDEVERKKVHFRLDDAERYNWHFIPRGRLGLALSEMGPAQRENALALLRASLSPRGFEKCEDVRSLEAILREKEGPVRRFPRDPELYYVSVFGDPASEGRWMWRFEGHHLSANFAVDSGQLIGATPFVLGANPALVASGPRQGLRVLAGMEDIARELVASLDEGQKRAALGGEPEEVRGMQRARYEDPLPAGISADRLSEKQRDTLRRLLREYTANLEDSVRARIEDDVARDPDARVVFAWRGGTQPGEGHSYIVHGPSFVVSYANFQDNARHVHSALRCRKGEFHFGE